MFFHVFRDTLYKVRKKCEKRTFFELFARRSAKSVRKQCFFPFFERHLYKVRKKSERTAFFLRDVMQKVWQNSVLSRFSRHFVQSSQKMRKISVFWAFCCDVPQKVWENSVFSRFSRHFVQSSQENAKNSVFWAFCSTFQKSVRKQCFFHVFRDTLNKVRKKCEKQRFLSFLLDVPQKVWGNSVFSRFSKHFVHS